MNNRRDVFDYLMTMNAFDGAPVSVSVAAVVNGVVDHNVVVVRQAPPRIVSDIVQRFEHVSLTPDGLHISMEPMD